VLKEYPQYPNGKFGDTVPRSGNSSGGGSAGWVLKCKNWKTDSNDYIYIILQAWGWTKLCDAIGKPEWKTDPAYATPEARGKHIFDVFGEIEKWLADKDKYQAVEALGKADVPVGPVLSMKEIAHDPSLRANGSVVEVEEEPRGKYLTVGCPMKFSAFTPNITGAPLLGANNNEVLNHLGYSANQISELRKKGVV
jgi:formyl-CoA transferase